MKLPPALPDVIKGTQARVEALCMCLRYCLSMFSFSVTSKLDSPASESETKIKARLEMCVGVS